MGDVSVWRQYHAVIPLPNDLDVGCSAKGLVPDSRTPVPLGQLEQVLPECEVPAALDHAAVEMAPDNETAT